MNSTTPGAVPPPPKAKRQKLIDARNLAAQCAVLMQDAEFRDHFKNGYEHTVATLMRNAQRGHHA